MNHRHPAPSRSMLTNPAPAHRRPHPSMCRRPAKRWLKLQPAACATIHVSAHPAPKVRRDARWRETTIILRLPAAVHVANPALPASARYQAPRRRGGAALRALRCAQARASATASPRWPCASRAPLPGSSHARGARGCPSGQRGRYVTRPAAGAFYERCVFALIHSRVWRSAHGRRGPPRCARTAPRPAPANAFALLSPPRETSRSICLPIARSGVPILPPSCHSIHTAAARLRRGKARVARAGDEQGRSPALPRNSLPREELSCALRLPAVADLRLQTAGKIRTCRRVLCRPCHQCNIRARMTPTAFKTKWVKFSEKDA